MPLIAQRHIKKMRGGAQSHLLQTGNGSFYVVKFRNNPQHRRILVNELIASVFLKYLQISAPDIGFIELTAGFLESNPDVCLTLGSRTVHVEPGWHFGSQFPGDPARMAVYDFLPDALLGKVHNLRDFWAILVFDKWMSNADGRQCVFYRARLPGHEPPTGWVVRMIDHGFMFNGPNWEFSDSPIQGLYPRRIVYDGIRSLDDFQPWLGWVEHFPESVIDRAWKQIPPDWIEGDEDQLERLLDSLLRRRPQVADLIETSRSSRVNPFPNWR